VDNDETPSPMYVNCTTIHETNENTPKWNTNPYTIKAPRMRCWSNNMVVEFKNVSPDSGADASMMSKEKFLEIVASHERDFVELNTKISANGPGLHALEVIGAVVMPIVLPINRPTKVEYPDEMCLRNTKAIKFLCM